MLTSASLNSISDEMLKTAGIGQVVRYIVAHPVQTGLIAGAGVGATILMKHLADISNIYYNRKQLQTMRSSNDRLGQLVQMGRASTRGIDPYGPILEERLS